MTPIFHWGHALESFINDADLPPGPGYQQWDQDRVCAWAARIGANTQDVVDPIFAAVC